MKRFNFNYDKIHVLKRNKKRIKQPVYHQEFLQFNFKTHEELS